MNTTVAGDPDDLARAILLRIVPTGYRLIDDADSRFTGVRHHFIRLALKHVGPKPSLVGFCAPGADAREAALAAAAWAAANLRPTAVQRSVRPGVLVIAIGDTAEPAVRAGMLEGAAAPATIWTVGPSGLQAKGRPPGSPSPRLVRDVQRRLLRGEPPPTIGHVDVAERTMMSGTARQRGLALSSGGILMVVLAGYLLLRFAAPAISGSGRPPTGTAPCAQGGCLVIDPGQLGSARTSTTVAAGQDTTILFRGLGDCPPPMNPSVASLERCVTSGGDQAGVVATYRGLQAGQSQLDLSPAAPQASFYLLVQ